MKPILTALLLLLVTSNLFGQDAKSQTRLSEAQWESLIQALANEDWVKAANQASKHLTEIRDDDAEHSRARLRYMFMFASAAKVAERKMSYEDLELALKDFIGKDVMTPESRIVSTCRSFNAICIKDASNLSLVSSNEAGTYIYMFQYAKLGVPVKEISLDSKTGAMRGTITGIEFNPNKSTIWIMRVFLEKATLDIGE